MVLSNETINFEDIPISALGPKSRQILSGYLDPVKIFKSELGHFRDWRGIFFSVGIENHYYSHIQCRSSDKMEHLLRLWSEHNSVQEANLAKLRNIFGEIDRWDIYDDTNQMFRK